MCYLQYQSGNSTIRNLCPKFLALPKIPSPSIALKIKEIHLHEKLDLKTQRETVMLCIFKLYNQKLFFVLFNLMARFLRSKYFFCQAQP